MVSIPGSGFSTLSRRGFASGLAGLAAFPVLAGGKGHMRLAEAARGRAPGGLTVLAPDGSEANLQVIATMFRDMSGVDIRVETTGIQSVGNDLILRHLSGGKQWDVALPATTELPDLIAAGAIRPMPDEPLRDPSDNSIYPYGDIFDGRRFGFLTDGDQHMLFFNRDILKGSDVAKSWEDRTGRPMAIPQSWSELDSQMRHVTRPEQHRWGGFITRTPGFVEVEFWLRFLAKGVWPLDADLVPQIAGDAGIETLNDMIAVQDALAPAAVGPGSLLVNARRFEEGRALCFLSYGGLQKILNRPGAPLAGRLDFSSPPGGGDPALPGSVPAMTWGWSFTVPERASDPVAATLFSAFAVSTVPSTEAIRVATGFFDPFLERHYNDDVIRQVYGDPFLNVHRHAMKNSIPDFYLARRGDYMAALARWLGLALSGRVTPQVALKTAETDWNLITSTINRDRQLHRWRAIRAAFPARISSKLRDEDRRAAISPVAVEGSPG